MDAKKCIRTNLCIVDIQAIPIFDFFFLFENFEIIQTKYLGVCFETLSLSYMLCFDVIVFSKTKLIL